MDEFEVYIGITQETADYPDSGAQYATNAAMGYVGLGLAGEMGEVADLLKKQIRKANPEMAEWYDPAFLTKLDEELGDLMWYFARICHHLKRDPYMILDGNVRKLQARKAAGEIREHG